MSHAVSARPGFGVTADPAARLLSVEGEFDVAARDRFAAATSALLTDRPGDVVVDLTGLRFIDAAGLGALVVLRNALRRREGRLELRGAAANTRRVFRAGGLSELLAGAG